MRLPHKFLIALLITIFISVLGAGWIAVQENRRKTLEQTHHVAEHVLEHVRRSLNRTASMENGDLAKAVNSLAGELHISIELIDPAGHTLKASADGPIHSVFPALRSRETLKLHARSGPGSVNGQSVYFMVTGLTGDLGQALRVGVPLSAPLFPWGRLFLFIVFLLVIALALSKVIAQTVYRETDLLLSDVERAEAGERPKSPSPELSADFQPLARGVRHLTRAIQTMRASVAAQKKDLEAILNGMQEGVLVLDADGRVLIANPSVRQIFHLSGRIIGREPIEFIHSPDVKIAYADIISKGERDPKRMLISLFGNRFFDTTIIPVSVGDHDELKVVMVFHDVSELKRLEKVRKDFVANVSHELRTPLTSIKGYTETLLSTPAPDADTVRSFIEVIRKNADSMNRQLEDLLQLARLEDDQAHVELQAVPLRPVVQTAWEVCAPGAEEKRVTLTADIGDEVSVLSEREQLTRVLINLVDNAIKYSPEEGTISIAAAFEHGKWTVSVQDDGPGVSVTYQHRIFERFFRTENKTRGGHIPGTGLGLSICKHILSTQGGKIWVTSPVPGQLHGSIFRFQLPAVTGAGDETNNR